MCANYLIEKYDIITVSDFENSRVGGSNPPSGTIFPVKITGDVGASSRNAFGMTRG
jgi:hypothetical protein